MDLIQSLKNIGLNEKEAQVYIALLQHPEATAYLVARHSGLKRPTTYVVLEDLIDKGIAIKIPRAKITQYSAISPEDLFSIASGRFHNAQNALPELKALSQGKNFKVRASYYEGVEGLDELYKKILKESPTEIVSFAGHGRGSSQDLLKSWDKFNEARIKDKISMRIITPNDPTNAKYLKDQEKYLLTAKALSTNEYDSAVSIEVYKNFVEIISNRHLQGILIENQDVASAVKQIFEMLWKKIN